jgi:GntR family transcriptional regulator
MLPKQVQITDLAFKPVDHKSPIPLYHQIETDLRGLIKSGQLEPGDILPPELELSRVYGVGRQTIRMALSRLATADVIARQAGRGTFVKSPPDQMKFYLDRSFTRQIADMGMKPRSKVIETATGIIGEDVPNVEGVQDGARYFLLTRLRLGDGQPIGLQSATIIADLCPGIENLDFNKRSLYDVLSNEFQLVISQIEHTVSAALADEFQAKTLKIHVNDPLLLVKTNAFLDSGQLIEFTTTYYRADKYEYSTTHTFVR